jgi:hypothetical protein
MPAPSQHAARPRDYIAYLLRLWRTGDSSAGVWRASLESPGSGERRGFANVQDLFEFLKRQMDEDEAPSADAEPPSA